MSWECHRCHKINAPWMSQCTCHNLSFTEYKFTGSVSVSENSHEKIYDLNTNLSTTYKLDICTHNSEDDQI